MMLDHCRFGSTMIILNITVLQLLLLHLLILMSQPFTSPSSKIGKHCQVMSYDIKYIRYFTVVGKAFNLELCKTVGNMWPIHISDVGSSTIHIHIFWFSRLYCESRLSSKRMSALLVLHHLLHHLLLSLAPVLPHLVEEVALHHHSKKCKVTNRSFF